MHENDFHKNYRNLLEGDTLEAIDDVWNNISMQLDKDAKTIQLEDDEHVLVDEAWGDIQDELDIDEVWSHITEELDEKPKRVVGYIYKKWLAAAIIILLIGISSLMPFFFSTETQPALVKVHRIEDVVNPKSLADQPNDTQYAVEAINDTTERSTQQSCNNTNATNNKLGSEELLRNKPDVKATNLYYPIVASRIKASSPKHTSGLYNNQPSDEWLVGKTAFVKQKHAFAIESVLVLPEKNELNDWTTSFNRNPIFDEKELLAYDRKDSRWTTGVVSALKNTYLLNSETYDAFSPTGMSSTNVSILPELGINVQYALNKRYIVDANVFLSSTSKQSYNTYSRGQYGAKDVQLSYVSAEFALKQSANNNFLSGDKVIRRNIAGVYVAHLTSASEVLLENGTDVTSNYSSMDYGFLLGQAFEIRTKGPIKVSTGLLLKYGLPNIYSGNTDLPKQFNKTHNASVEFRLGIAYRWRSKIGIDHYLGLVTRSK